MAAEVPIWGYQLEDWMNIGTAEDPNWIKMENLISFEFDDNEEDYEPDYIDAKHKKKFVYSRFASIDYEKDLYQNDDFDEFLVEIEDETNVAVQVARVKDWTEAKDAKMANFLLTPNQLDHNSAYEPVKLKGTLTMTDNDWTPGTFTDGKFTASNG